MPIASERQSSVNAGLMAGAVPETIAAPKPVSDFMEAFRTGFITVDDINKRVRQNVAETDQLKTSLAAGDLQRKQIGQAAELSPVNFELTKGKMEADKIKQQLEAAKLNEALVMQTGTPEEQKALMEKTQQLTDQAEYIKNYGRLPDTFTLPQQPLPPFEEWVKGSDYNDTLQAIEEAGGADTSSLNQVKDGTGQPFELQPSQEQLARRATMRAETLREAKAVYDQLNAERRQGETVKRGTPEYFKALRDKLESFRSQQSQKEVMLKAAPNILEQKAKYQTETLPKKEAEQKEAVVKSFKDEVQKDPILTKLKKQVSAANEVKAYATDPEIETNNMMQKQLLYSVVRSWDPESVVREGEIRLMQSQLGLGNRLELAYKSLTTGGTLNKQMISELAQMADKTMGVAKNQASSLVSQYEAKAKKLGIDREEYFDMIPVMPGVKTTPGTPAATAPGQSTPQAAPAAATPAKVLQKTASGVEIIEGKVYADKNGNRVRAMSNPDGTIRWEPVQ